MNSPPVAPPALTPTLATAGFGLPMVYLVDDEQVVRDALAWLLRSRRLLSEGFGSAEAFETMVNGRLPAVDAADAAGHAGGATEEPDWPTAPSCLLLDVRMPGTSGLVLFERLIERGLLAALPVIFLTGHGDVPTAVTAVKRGAFDFVEKPFADNALVDRVERALQCSLLALQARKERRLFASRLADLSEREREVMRLVIDGRQNKQIADSLHISVRTVEVHRARVFEKMDVKSAVELSNLIHQHANPDPDAAR